MLRHVTLVHQVGVFWTIFRQVRDLQQQTEREVIPLIRLSWFEFADARESSIAVLAAAVGSSCRLISNDQAEHAVC
jgi:5'-3' exonuclease